MRPIVEIDLKVLWAFLISPVANLFAFTHMLKRDVTKGTIERLPVPDIDTMNGSRLSILVDRYVGLMQAGHRDIFTPDGYTSEAVVAALLELDAEVLRLYRLPAKAERLLLEQFRSEQRPGIPIPFTDYYPSDTPDVPLYVYLSKSYQRALSGGSPELRTQERERYETLCEKADSGSLTSREADKLYELQAEVDGRDYWMLFAGKRSTPVVDTPDPDEFGLRLRALSDRAATASIKQSKK